LAKDRFNYNEQDEARKADEYNQTGEIGVEEMIGVNSEGEADDFM